MPHEIFTAKNDNKQDFNYMRPKWFFANKNLLPA